MAVVKKTKKNLDVSTQAKPGTVISADAIPAGRTGGSLDTQGFTGIGGRTGGSLDTQSLSNPAGRTGGSLDTNGFTPPAGKTGGSLDTKGFIDPTSRTGGSLDTQGYSNMSDLLPAPYKPQDDGGQSSYQSLYAQSGGQTYNPKGGSSFDSIGMQKNEPIVGVPRAPQGSTGSSTGGSFGNTQPIVGAPRPTGSVHKTYRRK